MTLRDIAFNNLRRRKGKAFFVFLGLLIGVSTVVTLLSFIDGMRRDIHDKVDAYGANILITPKSENLTITYGGLAIGGVAFDMQEIREEELAKIRTIKNADNVAAVGPILLGPVTVQGRQVLLAGIDFEATEILRAWWKIRGKKPRGDEVLAGSQAAAALGLSEGGTMSVNGRELTVAGLIEPTASQDDGIIFAPLPVAQRLLNKEGRISMAEVAAFCASCPIDEMVQQIADVLPQARVMPIMQVVKGRMETLGYIRKLSYGISALLLLVGCLVVFVTMTAMVKERTVEIGIFRAMGFRQIHVMKTILFEALALSALAGIAGYFTGYGAAKFILPVVTGLKDVKVVLDPLTGGGIFLVAIALGVVSSLYPAFLAARLDPNEALRAL